MLDYAKAKIRAGNGGKGIVSFRREKYVPKGGPAGGDGGKGGNVYLVASNEVSTLLDFQYLNHYEAEDGEAGGTSDKKGKEGGDLIIKIPVGSIIKINKLIVDIPQKKRKKSQYEEPIEYEQKMFNYKKMAKLKKRREEEELEKEENEEGPIAPEISNDELKVLMSEPFETEKVASTSGVDQNISIGDDDDDAGIMRTGNREISSEKHKIYKFSEREKVSARALRVEKSVQLKYQKEEIPVFDLDKEGMKILLARGGAGGRGNARFKWSQNQAPQYAEPGQRGEYVEVEIILKMVANVGIIGFPNAGKSTLLSKLTSASPKIANYPFTTLEPNLGVMTVEDSASPNNIHRLVLADIPGLIEGASQGKGLGYKFLQHVERTKILLHVIEFPELNQESTPKEATASIMQSYNTIRNELEMYGNNLTDKKEILVINKIDRISEVQRVEYIKVVEAELIKMNKPYVFVSAENELGLNGLKKVIHDTLVSDVQE